MDEDEWQEMNSIKIEKSAIFINLIWRGRFSRGAQHTGLKSINQQVIKYDSQHAQYVNSSVV